MGRFPEVAVEGALAPEASSGRREEELAIGAVEVDLGFEHPGEGCWDRDDAAGVGLAVVGLRRPRAAHAQGTASMRSVAL